MIKLFRHGVSVATSVVRRRFLRGDGRGNGNGPQGPDKEKPPDPKKQGQTIVKADESVVDRTLDSLKAGLSPLAFKKTIGVFDFRSQSLINIDINGTPNPEGVNGWFSTNGASVAVFKFLPVYPIYNKQGFGAGVGVNFKSPFTPLFVRMEFNENGAKVSTGLEIIGAGADIYIDTNGKAGIEGNLAIVGYDLSFEFREGPGAAPMFREGASQLLAPYGLHLP